MILNGGRLEDPLKVGFVLLLLFCHRYEVLLEISVPLVTICQTPPYRVPGFNPDITRHGPSEAHISSQVTGTGMDAEW